MSSGYSCFALGIILLLTLCTEYQVNGLWDIGRSRRFRLFPGSRRSTVKPDVMETTTKQPIGREKSKTVSVQVNDRCNITNTSLGPEVTYFISSAIRSSGSPCRCTFDSNCPNAWISVSVNTRSCETGTWWGYTDFPLNVPLLQLGCVYVLTIELDPIEEDVIHFENKYNITISCQNESKVVSVSPTSTTEQFVEVTSDRSTSDTVTTNMNVNSTSMLPTSSGDIITPTGIASVNNQSQSAMQARNSTDIGLGVGLGTLGVLLITIALLVFYLRKKRARYEDPIIDEKGLGVSNPTYDKVEIRAVYSEGNNVQSTERPPYTPQVSSNPQYETLADTGDAPWVTCHHAATLTKDNETILTDNINYVIADTSVVQVSTDTNLVENINYAKTDVTVGGITSDNNGDVILLENENYSPMSVISDHGIGPRANDITKCDECEQDQTRNGDTMGFDNEDYSEDVPSMVGDTDLIENEKYGVVS